MVCSLSCAFLVSIADRDFAPADGYWSAQISHRIRFNRGCLRGQDTCRLRNHDIGRGRIQKGRLSIVCREKFSLFPPRSCAHHRLTVAGEWRYSHLRRKGSARQAQAAPALLLPQWRPRSRLRWSPSSGWTALASLAPFVASASSPGTCKSGCDVGTRCESMQVRPRPPLAPAAIIGCSTSARARLASYCRG
jgi:hypothetical protein